jgi:hypothetical protein
MTSDQRQAPLFHSTRDNKGKALTPHPGRDLQADRQMGVQQGQTLQQMADALDKVNG